MAKILMSRISCEMVLSKSTTFFLLQRSTQQPLTHRHLSMPSMPAFLTRKKKPKVAVVHLCGTIMPNLGNQRGKQINLDSMTKPIETAFAVKGLKEVCLVINSPGGSPVQSELISNKIMHLSRTKDINVTSFVEDYAASGGYWLALAGNEFFSAESSIVGSIGVIGSSFGLENILKKFDIDRRVKRMGKNKDIMDPFVPETDEKREIIDRNLTKIYMNFQNYVKERRGEKLSTDTDALFSGEYWIGEDAVNLGLIDGVKTLNDYIYEKYKDEVQIVKFGQRKSLSALFGSSLTVPTVSEVIDDLSYESYKFR